MQLKAVSLGLYLSKSLLSFLITFDPGACHDHLTETRGLKSLTFVSVYFTRDIGLGHTRYLNMVICRSSRGTGNHPETKLFRPNLFTTFRTNKKKGEPVFSFSSSSFFLSSIQCWRLLGYNGCTNTNTKI